MKIDLNSFYEKMRDDKLNYTTEEYLFMVNVDFHHLMSLLWSKNTRKVTDNYKIFLVSECIKNFVNACIASKLDIAKVEEEVNICYKYFNNNLKGIDIDELITSFNNEIKVDYDTVNIIGLICYFITTRLNCSWNDIYNSQKFE